MASSRMPGEAINADEGFEKTKETDRLRRPRYFWRLSVRREIIAQGQPDSDIQHDETGDSDRCHADRSASLPFGQHHQHQAPCHRR
jgi:hypothetical protein